MITSQDWEKQDWEKAEQIANETKIKVFWDDHWYITNQGTIGLKENAISGPFDSTEAAFKSLLPNEETDPEPGPKYGTCPKCKKGAVHLATAYVHNFYGDGDDNHGNPSEYADLEPPPGVHPYESPEVSLFAHFCFECGHMEDVGIEFPRDRAIDTSTKNSGS